MRIEIEWFSTRIILWEEVSHADFFLKMLANRVKPHEVLHTAVQYFIELFHKTRLIKYDPERMDKAFLEISRHGYRKLSGPLPPGLPKPVLDVIEIAKNCLSAHGVLY